MGSDQASKSAPETVADTVLAIEDQRKRPRASRPEEGSPGADCASWLQERSTLLDLLARQQRAAQAGLITAALAHDVANYVQQISGAAFLSLQSRDPEDWKGALDTVQEQCRNLSEVTNAFLGLLERRETKVGSVVAVSRVFAQAARITRTHARKKGIALEYAVTDDFPVAGDSRLLVQALLNLVLNAVQACAQHRGRIRVESSRPSDGVGRIRVCDNGPGIPEEIRPYLFRPLTPDRGGSGGHGIGLYVVNQAVGHLRGRIRYFTSEAGTTFEIDLPAPA